MSKLKLFFCWLVLFFTQNAFSQSWTEEQKLILNNQNTGDLFGTSVAVSGNTAIVGASGIQTNGTNSGAAFVFELQAGNWVQMAELTASDADTSDTFGISVAISGDKIVVGAFSDDISGNQNQGSAYVFEKPTNGWSGILSETLKLTASNGNANDHFGRSVGISGNTIVVGAEATNTFGKAYVFELNAGNWTEKAILIASDPLVGNRFGVSVSISGNSIAVGSRINSDTSRVYIFEKPQNGWNGIIMETAQLRSSSQNLATDFGFSVSISGNIVLVGAQREDLNGMDSGSAYIFEKPQTGWTGIINETAKLTASDGESQDRFGKSLSISGDNIIVGVQGNDDNGSNSGSAYIFEKPQNGWTGILSETIKLTASDGDSSDLFGNQVSIDGNNALICAQADENNNITNSGSVYYFKSNIPSYNEKIHDNNIFSIYPNPAKNHLTIKFNETQKLEFKIFSIDGKLIKQFRLKSSNQISIEELNSGIYFLEAENENKIIRKKFVVLR